jgi:hypothetical protein
MTISSITSEKKWQRGKGQKAKRERRVREAYASSNLHLRRAFPPFPIPSCISVFHFPKTNTVLLPPKAKEFERAI